MKIMGMGINYSTGSLLVNPIDEKVFAEEIQKSLSQNIEYLKKSCLTTASVRRPEEMQSSPSKNLNDPRDAGWTFLVNRHDPQFAAILEVLRPLAEHRGMEQPENPIFFENEPSHKWIDWLIKTRYSPAIQKRPHYILIVADPYYVPFRFQSFLDMDPSVSVGRVDFNSIEDLHSYIQKILRLETAPSPVVSKEAVFFAPDGGQEDPTYFSRRYMATPLSEEVQTDLRVKTYTKMGDEATKEQLLQLLQRTNPALVYTASHGLWAPKEDLEKQKKLNGAICCQPTSDESMQDCYMTADDIPLSEAFLEGSIFFQFACFGYGTPAESDFNHWLGNDTLNTQADFTAALPKRLLAHPQGPIGFIGHVDMAWLHGFLDPQNIAMLNDRWHSRIAPFVEAVRSLLNVEPVGRSMRWMNQLCILRNKELTDFFDDLQRGHCQLTPEVQAKLVDSFITRSDAQNYMVFGDPAVRLRIPTE